MPNFFIEGTRELEAKLRELASPKEQAMVLRAAVREPMKEVFKVAKQNLSKISPGKREIHRTYKGRLVTRGFASRSMRMITVLNKAKTAAWCLIGVRKEAYYVLQFFELGTAKIARQPWLAPAFYQSRHELLRGVGEQMKARIERIARKRSANAA